ncbi:chromosome segregation protein SMC [Phragmitibacter flavus]|uniref:Chromosome partition protein Smc n=1 Tax=Phragmitibacter flavus TaxID=2576071 RepID=A0A5R8KFV3_9BACT|nr:chromosome segregation protein SMC [Phragmitibacter flavus]TLD70469.1 chromosome segregation protein SMC [Phragmitibacter flavus]
MHLKSLEIHGFKSFADKTTFEFHTGVTGIVGPNGCGKSNVVDAIRWVLGETSAKALRGGEMADVIFNGTDKRKPVGMAEVTLTLADCEEALNVEYNEVALQRRVFRDGRSEYRINGTICRLKDFQELLAGTGIGRAAYSVMEQGKIDMLISAKPEDRRMVFEEAAGITRFKGQKKEALRKLEYTEANLIRVADIVAEVKRQMGTLHRQAQKAKRYQSIHKDLRTLDIHLGHKHFTEFNAEKSESENQIISLMTQLNELHQKIHTKESEVSETREAYHQVESSINTLRQQAQEHRSKLQAAESKIEFNRERVEELEGRIRRNEEDAENNREMVDRQRRELAAADEQFASIRHTIESRRYDVEEHQVGHNAIIPERQQLEVQRRNLREDFRRLESEAASAEARAQNLSQQMNADRQRHETLQHDRQNAARDTEASQQEFDHLQRQIEEQESTRAELEQNLKDIANQIAEQRRQRDLLTEELHQLQRQGAQKKSRLEALSQIIEKGEGLEQGTQNVIKGLDDPDRLKPAIHGILASAIQVEPAYIPAIEAALRDHLQTILLDDEKVAGEIIEKLTAGRLGKTTLAPQSFLRGQRGSERQFMPNGGIAWALDKVTAQAQVQPLMERLLRDVLIVADLATAFRLKADHPDLSFVTNKGELLTVHGIVHGGATKDEATSALRRETELRELRTESAALEQQIAEKEQFLEELGLSLEAKQRAEANARDSVQLNREALSQLQGKVSVVQRALQQATAKLDSLEWEQSQISARLAEAENQIGQHRETGNWATRQIEETQERERQLEAQIEAVIRREMESTERLNELKTALAIETNALQNIEQQKAPLANRLEELEGSINRYENECFIWRQRIDSANAENARLLEETEESRQLSSSLEAQGSEAVERRNQMFAAVSSIESEVNAMRKRQSELGEHRSRAEVQQTRVELKLENLIAQISERYSIQLDAFEPDPHALLLALSEQRKHFDRGGRKRKVGNESFGLDSGSAEDGAAMEEQVVAAEETSEVVAETILGGEFGDLPIQSDTLPEPDWDLIQEIVNDLRQRLEGMGSVNLDAIQEFEELEERHNFLDTQHNDLIKSKDELLQVIAKINETTKTMFVETFVAVRTNFRSNFKELFGAGAQADLILQDESDPLECGIEIIAKPPGKKLQSISLLSGGERSMTAVALLFSIYMVKPSPFCVLDELDAPLDESNIKRFLLMLEKFLVNSQFIIVTHNKRTMSVADVIYGVTMQEFGVSKPVGVRMTGEKMSLEDGPTTVADTVRGPANANSKPSRSKKGEESLI